MISLEILLPAFLVGLMGAGHCLGMCGGIVAALSFAVPEATATRRFSLVFSYNIGRIVTYTTIGALVGYIGHVIELQVGLAYLRIAAGVMLILMGLYVTGWWKVLGVLEKGGAVLWRLLQPLGQKFFPVRSIFSGFAVGCIWGWLPCGLVYSALVLAAAQGDTMSSALVMLAFGLGTLPAVLIGGLAGEKLKAFLQKKSLRTIMGVLVILFGLWTLYFVYAHRGHSHHDHSAHASHKSSASHQHQHGQHDRQSEPSKNSIDTESSVYTQENSQGHNPHHVIDAEDETDMESQEHHHHHD